MQAATVVGKVIQKDYTPLPDLALINQLVKDTRTKFTEILTRIIRDEATYKIVEEIMVKG
ncbi:MAG: hypothetical protein ACI9RZ_000902 [Sphingobacteriales bacterium]|jgi:hypothetical protein